jgi:Flp pilus assembly protein TadB
MSLSTSFWQFLLMAMVGLLAAHLLAAAVLNWSVSTRRQRSPVRRLVQRRLLQRVARAGNSERP